MMFYCGARKLRPAAYSALKSLLSSRSSYGLHNTFRLNNELTSINVFVFNQKRSLIPYSLIQRKATGINLPGQGLNKISPEQQKKVEENSAILRFINRRIKEQEEGKKKFSYVPDYKFIILFVVLGYAVFMLGWSLIVPDVKIIVFGEYGDPSFLDDTPLDKVDSPLVYLYLSLPLRILSRMVGRLMEMRYEYMFRRFMAKSFCRLTGAKPEEALVTDLSKYKSIGAFFRRPINPDLRPIDETVSVVCPADGKVLVYGSVENGRVEQVKGVSYSLRKFLGPREVPELDDKDTEIKTLLSKPPSENFEKSLMHDPDNNKLYTCVVYLGPGDYHGFHSPCDWVVKKRRHFVGELLSVNPKVARWVKNLFVLNERVVLSGVWEHGFFSMTAVGATNVGNIKIHGDVLLNTNKIMSPKRSVYDFDLENDGKVLKKGDPVGEFNLGSTIVLIFEAPKDFRFDLQTEQKIKYGEKICKSTQ